MYIFLEIFKTNITEEILFVHIFNENNYTKSSG